MNIALPAKGSWGNARRVLRRRARRRRARDSRARLRPSERAPSRAIFLRLQRLLRSVRRRRPRGSACFVSIQHWICASGALDEGSGGIAGEHVLEDHGRFAIAAEALIDIASRRRRAESKFSVFEKFSSSRWTRPRIARNWKTVPGCSAALRAAWRYAPDLGDFLVLIVDEPLPRPDPAGDR